MCSSEVKSSHHWCRFQGLPNNHCSLRQIYFGVKIEADVIKSAPNSWVNSQNVCYSHTFSKTLIRLLNDTIGQANLVPVSA